MNLLILRGFNNYFNRVIKKYSTLLDYKENSSDYLEFSNINFNPNDGVATELILGNNDQKDYDHGEQVPLDFEVFGSPDYIVCYEGEGIIKSRWFVLECERTRYGQYRIALKRDVVAEHFNQIKVSPCFIEKGMINDISDPLLYNKESMTFNQIKTDEIPLKDSTKCGWLVGYVSKNLPTSENVSDMPNISGEIKIDGLPGEYYNANDLPFEFNQDLNTVTKVYIGVKNFVGKAPISFESKIHYSIVPWNDPYTEYKQSLVSYEFSSYNSNGPVTTIMNVRGNPGAQGPRVATGGYFNTSDMDGRQYTLGGDNKVTYGANNSKFSWWANGWHTGSGDYGDVTVPTPDFLLTYGSVAVNLSSYQTRVTSILTALDSASPSNSIYKSAPSNSSDSLILPYNNKYVKIGQNYYKMHVNYAGAHYTIAKSSNNNVAFTPGETGTSNTVSMTNSTINDFFNLFATVINDRMKVYDSYYSDNRYYTEPHTDSSVNYSDTAFVYRLFDRYEVTLTLVNTMTVTIPNREYTNRNHTYDSVADIFAIPYGEIPFKTTSGGDTYYTDKYTALGMARILAGGFSTNCYDLQVVPYAPSDIIRNYTDDDGTVLLYELETAAYQTFNKTVDNQTAISGFCLWCSSCRGTFNIPINSIVIPSYSGVYSDALNYKLSNETQVYRLVSPNFNGIYEFSVAKNKGLSSFNVDYYYQPGMPYIHINPGFNEDGLYGKDWNDIKGLICGGNFSMAIQINHWIDYVSSNKNYQQIFDRQIQNIDVNNSIAMEKQKFQATVGAITGTIGGGISGAMTGAAAGPWGALAGAVIGTAGGAVAGGIGAAKDIEWLQRQQQESRSYAIDMYGYQLGNIQAMPYSIRGSDSLTENNKIWPILEIFNPKLEEDFKSKEVEVLKSKIQYNGMTIMAVGKIEDYCNSDDFDKVFIKGQLIRLDNIDDDFHIADAIYQEINKGVYIPSGGL